MYLLNWAFSSNKTLSCWLSFQNITFHISVVKQTICKWVNYKKYFHVQGWLQVTLTICHVQITSPVAWYFLANQHSKIAKKSNNFLRTKYIIITINSYLVISGKRKTIFKAKFLITTKCWDIETYYEKHLLFLKNLKVILKNCQYHW